MLKIFLMLMLFLTSLSSQSAVITKVISYEGDCGIKITFNGDIVKGDLERLQSIFGEIKRCNEERGFPIWSEGVFLHLDSLGGSVDDAIALGRFVRRASMITRVPSRCHSSCVLVYAAGVKRFAAPNSIGLHRPYFAGLKSGIGYVEIFELRRQVVDGIKRYIQEIDVSGQLVEDMLAIPPDQIKLLTHNELKDYRLFGTDPTYEEKQVADQASRFGINMMEYRKRNAMSSACTGDADEFTSCWYSHILKIPLPEARRRHQRYEAYCKTNFGGTERDLMKCWKEVVVRGL